ncbi:hypothetical protein C8R45DRAFT_1045279 [Mycena sanguinolenta]|nr:hypothetical protein C8R45DRAFT_1045279 [Mycena sanguinolenta]
MPFEALGEDVLVRVFSFCDISTALVVSTLNKAFLRHTAWSKQLWISLVLGATFRDALALPPPDREQLECLSTEELIDVVKNAVAGPGSDWNYSSITTTGFQIPLDMEFGIPEFCFLPGAPYILMHSTSQQRFSRRLWHSPVQAQTQCQGADLLPGGTIARVFIAQTAVLPNKNALHIEEVDLSTEASHEIFNFGFASTVLWIMPSAIVGDLLLCTVLHSHSHFNDPTVVLVDWRASTFASVGRMGSNVRLIPGYIISTYRESGPPYKHFLSVRALEAFSAHWQRLTEDNLASRVDGSAPASDITIGAIAMQARLEHDDAVHAGRYNIFVHCRLQSSEPPLRPVTHMERIGNLISMTVRREKVSLKPGRMLLSYKFTPGHGRDGSKLRPASAQRGANPLQSPGVMFTLGLRNLVDIVYWQRRADVA